MHREKIRTINQAYDEIKSLDPDTAISRSRIRQLVKSGEIPSIKAGNRYLVSLRTVRTYIEKHT